MPLLFKALLNYGPGGLLAGVLKQHLTSTEPVFKKIDGFILPRNAVMLAMPSTRVRCFFGGGALLHAGRFQISLPGLVCAGADQAPLRRKGLAAQAPGTALAALRLGVRFGQAPGYTAHHHT